MVIITSSLSGGSFRERGSGNNDDFYMRMRFTSGLVFLSISWRFLYLFCFMITEWITEWTANGLQEEVVQLREELRKTKEQHGKKVRALEQQMARAFLPLVAPPPR